MTLTYPVVDRTRQFQSLTRRPWSECNGDVSTVSENGLASLLSAFHTSDDCVPCGSQSVSFRSHFLRGRRRWRSIKRLTVLVSRAFLRPAGVRRVITRHNTQVDKAIPTRVLEVLVTIHRFSFGCESQAMGEPITVAVLVNDFDFVAHR